MTTTVIVIDRPPEWTADAVPMKQGGDGRSTPQSRQRFKAAKHRDTIQHALTGQAVTWHDDATRTWVRVHDSEKTAVRQCQGCSRWLSMTRAAEVKARWPKYCTDGCREDYKREQWRMAQWRRRQRRKGADIRKRQQREPAEVQRFEGSSQSGV